MKTLLKKNMLVLGMFTLLLCMWMNRPKGETCESAWNASVLKASFIEHVEMGEIRAVVERAVVDSKM